jgi:hypothetical protein
MISVTIRTFNSKLTIDVISALGSTAIYAAVH